MPRPVKPAAPGRFSAKRVLGVVLAVAALAFLGARQSNFLVGRSLMIAFGDNEVTYSGAWYRWNGDITASNVVIDPFGAGSDTSIRFDRVEVDTPGWLWIAFTFTDRKFKRTRADRVHITLRGASGEMPYDPSLGDLGPFSLHTASPFEAEGCLHDSFWVRDELVQMGLNPGETTLEFDYRVEGERLDTTIVLHTPGVSRVQLDRRSRVPQGLNALAMDHFPEQVEWERWSVQDLGFVAARNRHCAGKDGVDERSFVQRHVDSVERLLDTQGLGVDAQTWQQYRRFARDGGSLVLAGDYAPPIDIMELYDLRGTSAAMTRMHNAALEFGGRRNSVVWEEFSPRPLAGQEEGEPTFALLAQEREREAEERARREALGGIPPADAPTAPAPMLAASASAANLTTVAPQPTPAPSTGAVAPAAGAPPESAGIDASLPATTDASAAAPVRRDGMLGWEELAGLEGRRVRVWTIHSPARSVELVSVGATEIRVLARLGGGAAEYSVQRDAFVRAKLLP